MPATRAQEIQGSGFGANPTAVLTQAASLRGPMRGEIAVLTGTALQRVYNVPSDWRGRILNVYAEGGIVYHQLSTDLNASVDIEQKSQETLVSGRYTIASSVAKTECWPIGDKEWQPVSVPVDALTWAFKCSGDCKIRIHVAET